MDFSYGPEYDDFRGELKGFLAEHWPAGGGGEGESWEDMVERAARFRAQAVAQGYLLRWGPRQFGGSEQEPDAVKAAIIREEFHRTRAPDEPRGIGLMMLVPTLLERGEEWQKEKFVPATVAGDYKWC